MCAAVAAEYPDHSRVILNCMVQRERSEIGKFILWILLSLPGILFDALFLSGIVFLLGPMQHNVPWRDIFLWCIPGAILLFWLIDALTPKSNLSSDDTSVASGLTTIGGSMELSPWTYAAGAGGTRGMPVFTEIVLAGPRVLGNAIQRFRAARAVQLTDRTVAVRILGCLLAVEHGLDTESLLQSHEPPSALMRPLAYLIFHGWIDSSQDTRHVWLSANTRVIIEKAISTAA